MNEAKFSELVNLYVDQEISAQELHCLQQELSLSPARQREFDARCRLHRAMRLAMAADARTTDKRCDLSRQQTARANRLIAWIAGSGVALGLSFAVLLLSLMAWQSLLEPDNSSYLETPLLGSDLERFAMHQAVASSRRGSLAAHLRLLGLSPELAPADDRLSSVDLQAMRQREAYRQVEIERMDRYKAYSAMPAPKLFDYTEHLVPVRQESRWSAGFKSTLAGF